MTKDRLLCVFQVTEREREREREREKGDYMKSSRRDKKKKNLKAAGVA